MGDGGRAAGGGGCCNRRSCARLCSPCASLRHMTARQLARTVYCTL
jgi:hypothetical protein